MRRLGQSDPFAPIRPASWTSQIGSYIPSPENPFLPAPGTDILIDPEIVSIVPEALQLLPSPTPGTVAIAVPEFPSIYTAIPDPMTQLMPLDPNAVFVPVPNQSIEAALLDQFFLAGGYQAGASPEKIQELLGLSYDQKKRLYDQIIAGIIPFPIAPVQAQISVPGVTAAGEYLQINSAIVDQAGTPIGTAGLPPEGAGILAPADVTILAASAPGIFQNLSGVQKWLLGGVIGLTAWSGLVALSGALGKDAKRAAA